MDAAGFALALPCVGLPATVVYAQGLMPLPFDGFAMRKRASLGRRAGS